MSHCAIYNYSKYEKRRCWVMAMIMRLGAVIIFSKHWWNDASVGVESSNTAVAGDTRQNCAEVLHFLIEIQHAQMTVLQSQRLNNRMTSSTSECKNQIVPRKIEVGWLQEEEETDISEMTSISGSTASASRSENGFLEMEGDLENMDRDDLLKMVQEMRQGKINQAKRKAEEDRLLGSRTKREKAKKITSINQLDEPSRLSVERMSQFKAFIQSRIYNRIKYLELESIQAKGFVSNIAHHVGVKDDDLSRYKLCMEIVLAKKIEQCRNTTIKYIHQTHDRHRMALVKGKSV
jgi:hypothetical protein